MAAESVKAGLGESELALDPPPDDRVPGDPGYGCPHLYGQDCGYRAVAATGSPHMPKQDDRAAVAAGASTEGRK
jgi:hypothetical protein